MAMARLGRLALVILFGCGVVLGAIACETGPTHNGRSIASWMADLDAKHEFQRRAACEALGEIGPLAKRAIPRMVELLEDEDGRVQFAAAEALAKMGPAALPQLELLLDRSEPDLRYHAAVTLLDIDPKHAGAVDQLMQTLIGIGDVALAKQAQERAIRLGAPLVPQLLQLLEDDYGPVRVHVVKTIAGIGKAAREAIPPLVTLFKTEKDAKVRRSIVSAVARLGPREVVEPHIREFTNDKDETVIVTANSMLEFIGAIERPTMFQAGGGEGNGEPAGGGSNKPLRSLLSDPN